MITDEQLSEWGRLAKDVDLKALEYGNRSHRIDAHKIIKHVNPVLIQALRESLRECEEMKDGVQKMIENEQCGGNGWWAGFEKLKAMVKMRVLNDNGT